jgi:hypothetical protein
VTVARRGEGPFFLTAVTYLYRAGCRALFPEASDTGDYYWTVTE